MTDNDLMSRELAASELAAISAAFYVTRGPNPPRGEDYGHHEPPHREPPQRYYPGGSPHSPGLRGFFH